nr:transposase [uncultured Cohaesibacter sp.]
MTRRRYELTDFEWSIIEPLLPNKPRGVARVDDRRVINGILWRFRTGSPWADIPERCGPYTTCYNRFVRWRKACIWGRLLHAISKAYDSNAIRAKAKERGAWASIPPKRNRKASVTFSKRVYKQRILVDRFFNKLKQFRAIATRYEKNPLSFLAAIKLVAALIWIRSLCVYGLILLYFHLPSDNPVI